MAKLIYKIIILLLTVVLIFALFSCKKEDNLWKRPEVPVDAFTIAAGERAFVNHESISLPTAILETIIIGDYEIIKMDILSRLVIYRKESEYEGNVYTYAVKNLNNEQVLSLGTTEITEIINCSIDHNIIIALKENQKSDIYTLQGELIISDVQADNIYSMGDYHFKAIIDNKAQVYTIAGEPVFSNSIYYFNSNTQLYSCNNKYFVATQSNGSSLIYNNNGTVEKLFENVVDVTNIIYYLGNGYYLIVQNTIIETENITASVEYDVKISEDEYLSQKTYVYDIENDITQEFFYGKVIYNFQNRYNSIESRYFVNDGFSVIRTYNIDSDKTIVSTYPYKIFVADRNMYNIIEYGQDINIVLYFIDNVGLELNRALTSTELNIRMIGIDGNISWQADELLSNNLVYGHNNNRLIIAIKEPDLAYKYGVYSDTGTKVVDYTYDHISAFYGGFAVARIDDISYIMNSEYELTEINGDVVDKSNYGLYSVQNGDYLEIYNNNGTLLADTSYAITSIDQFYTDNSLIYVVYNSGGITNILQFI